MELRIYRYQGGFQARIRVTQEFIQKNNLKNKNLVLKIKKTTFPTKISYYKRINSDNSEVTYGAITIPRKIVEYLNLEDGNDIKIKVISNQDGAESKQN